MSQLYVPEGVFLVCTEGMKKQELIITSQSSIRIADGRLIGTENDRMNDNHNCALMVIAGAIIGAIIGAVVVAAILLSGGTLGAVAAGAICAGCAAGGAGLGAVIGAFVPCICAMLTSGWMPTHPYVLCESQKPLLEYSYIPCKLKGIVQIVYSEEKANALTTFKIAETALSTLAVVFVAYTGGAAIAGIASSVGSVITTFKLFGAKAAAFQAGGTIFGLLVPNIFSDFYQDIKDNEHITINGFTIQEHINGTADGLEDNRVNVIVENRITNTVDNVLDPLEDSAEGVLNNQFDSFRYQNHQTNEIYNTGNVIVVSSDGTALPQNTTVINSSQVTVSNISENASIAPASTTVTESTTISSEGIISTQNIDSYGVQYHNSIENEIASIFTADQIKDDFKSFLKEILKDAARLAANKALSSFIEKIEEAEIAEEAAKAKISVIEHQI